MIDKQTKADKWFTHLSVEQRFVLCGKDYPESTCWWNAMSEDERDKVYDESRQRFDVAHYKVPKNMPSFT